MAGPYDYSLNVGNPFQSALQGYQSGLAINQAEMQQQAQQAEMQQRQAALQAQQRTQQDLYALSANQNATGADYAAVMTRNPQLSKQLNEAWGVLNDQQKQSRLQTGSQAYAAILQGKPEIAKKVFADLATSAKNSGNEEAARQADTMAQLMDASPESVRTSMALFLSNALGPEKFAETFSKLGGERRAGAQEARTAELHPSNLAESQAKAQSAITGAKFAESKAVQDLNLGQAQIAKMAADTEIARMNSRIAAMNAATSREGNALKRDELRLKLDEAITKRDEKVREKTADYQAGHATLQDAMTLIGEIKSNKFGLKGATGATAWGSVIPGTASRDAAAKIEQLQNLMTAGNLDKLKGPMSDKDIAFLKSLSSNLDRGMSEESFVKELDKVESAVIRNEKILRERYGSAANKPAPTAEPAAQRGGAAPGPQKQRNVTVDW